MYPWSLDDYKRACQNKEFYDSVAPFLCDNVTDINATPDLLIERKFIYAGVCARWMFDTKTAEVIESINDMIEYVEDVTAHQNLLVGTKSDKTTNGLVVKHSPDSPLF